MSGPGGRPILQAGPPLVDIPKELKAALPNVSLHLAFTWGSGKTYTIARAARFLAQQGKRVLIVQPTKDLIEKTIEKEIKSCSPQVDCEAIHGDSHPGKVKLEIIERLEINDDCPGQGHGTITLVTHAAFINEM